MKGCDDKEDEVVDMLSDAGKCGEQKKLCGDNGDMWRRILTRKKVWKKLRSGLFGWGVRNAVTWSNVVTGQTLAGGSRPPSEQKQQQKLNLGQINGTKRIWNDSTGNGGSSDPSWAVPKKRRKES